MRLTTRHALIRAVAALTPVVNIGPTVSPVHAAAVLPSVEVPLSLCGGAYCLGYSIEGQQFRAIVDTGSPFLLADGTCTARTGSPELLQGRWGCYRGEAREAAGLSDSELSFAGQNVLVQWRRGAFALETTEASPPLRVANATFGVVRGSQRTSGSADEAIFLGLVKERGPRLGRYPTLLEQTSVASMRFNFLMRRMLLSAAPLIDAQSDAVRILDLRPPPCRAPDLKYACKVSRLLINGRAVPNDAPVVAIIDTGTTGLTISQELYDSTPQLYAERAAAVRIELPTEQGGICALEASVRRRRSAATGIPSVDVDLAAPEFDEFPLVVSPVPIRWGSGKRGTPYVLFVGLAFLWQRQLTIDVDARRLTVE